MLAARHILVVDDDTSLRDHVVQYLAEHGYCVHAAANAEEMEKQLSEQPVDLIVLDVMMPGEDGLSICRRLAGGGVGIIMVSAMGEEIDRVLGLELGADDYLAKPCSPRELLARVRAVLRRQDETRGGAPKTRQAYHFLGFTLDTCLLYTSEVDFLVATDAIGMGLNMDVDHVAFAGLRKFDGKRTRFLHPQEVGQIAGRAGRFRTDGTFGVTGECEDMDTDLVEAVEQHRFEPVAGAEWRNAKLDFSSLANLLRSLSTAPGREGLKLSAEALDEQTLRKLAAEPEVAERCGRDRSALILSLIHI